MIVQARLLRSAIVVAASMVLTDAAQAATAGIPMTGSEPQHPWFDWILFAILVPWLLFAVIDYVLTRNHR